MLTTSKNNSKYQTMVLEKKNSYNPVVASEEIVNRISTKSNKVIEELSFD